MSIKPKLAIKGRTKKILLHVRVANHLDERIKGTIKVKVKRPSGKIDIFEKDVCIEPYSFINEYFKYPLADKPVGRYLVDGRFYWKKGCVRSETWKKDFFDVKIKRRLDK